ncbi:hypothetical protein GB937_004353 [Aspergillus fischeri]|nr:hypothetical protein GB937_004353 [Aspergillus fischeri]
MKLSLLTPCVFTAALAASHPANLIYIAPLQCSRGFAYCGWDLKNEGFSNLPHYSDQAIYYCENIYYPDHVKKCDDKCGMQGLQAAPSGALKHSPANGWGPLYITHGSSPYSNFPKSGDKVES